MAELRVRGLVAAYVETKKYENGQPKVDKDGVQIMSRKLSVMDLDEDNVLIFKVNVPVDAVARVKSLVRQNVQLIAQVGVFNTHTYYKLLQVEAE